MAGRNERAMEVEFAINGNDLEAARSEISQVDDHLFEDDGRPNEPVKGKFGFAHFAKIGVDVDSAQKIWLALQALGNIAFAYSYSMVLIEIQDTLKSPPAENKVMKKASFLGVTTTTTFYLLNGLLGYVAFGNHAPGNILSGFYEPYWLVGFANVCIVVHLAGAYQLFCQPLYTAVESQAAKTFPGQKFVTNSKTLKLGEQFEININLFRIVWRTIFVSMTTLLAILMPFFNSILGFLGATAFWPLTVYFPVEMYIKSKQNPVMSPKWIGLQSLSLVCFLISVGATCASIEGIIESLKTYTPFTTK
ncbi:hypothetical protein LUZ60_000484 [Juncus effusus]|nr:hypothetical protein LUZ60_000484 [Juncus effusus]